MRTLPDYPWFAVIDGDDIEQGDIFEDCPVFMPPEDLSLTAANVEFTWEQRDVIVMSQSCDLSKGREKVDEVLLCAVWKRSELTAQMAKRDTMEDARKGRLPSLHLLAPSEINGFEREVRLVDFRRAHSLPLAFLRAQARKTTRLRLLPLQRAPVAVFCSLLYARWPTNRYSTVQVNGTSGTGAHPSALFRRVGKQSPRPTRHLQPPLARPGRSAGLWPSTHRRFWAI
jgi:hypothetical protein